MGSYEYRLAWKGPKARGQAGQSGEESEVETDHSEELEANVEGLFEQNAGPCHASVVGSGEDPRVRVWPKDLRLQHVGEGIAQGRSPVQLEGQLWGEVQRVEVKDPEKWTRDQEGPRQQIGAFRHRCSIHGDCVLAVPSCHLVESGLRESGRDLTCY